jgi:hypothetical protein
MPQDVNSPLVLHLDQIHPTAPSAVFTLESVAFGALSPKLIGTRALLTANEVLLCSEVPGFRSTLCPRGRSDLLGMSQSIPKMEFRAITLAVLPISRAFLPHSLCEFGQVARSCGHRGTCGRGARTIGAL